MNQRGRHGRVDAARQSHQHLVGRADLLANLGEFRLDKIRHRPIAALATDFQHEVAQHLRAARRVHDLGMKLDSAHAPVARLERRVRRVVTVRDRAQRARNRLDAIAVTHPYAMLASAEPFEQQVVAVDHQRRGSVLALTRAHTVRAHVLRDHVQPVADPQHRAAEIQHLVGDIGRILFVEAGWSAGKNDSAGIQRADCIRREIERMDFAIHVRFAHAARD